jgi:hypothetical protein
MMNKKTRIYFGPPLAILTEGENNTMEISGRINRTAERYLEIMKGAGIELSDAERACVAKICDFGFMAPYEIRELPIEQLPSLHSSHGLSARFVCVFSPVAPVAPGTAHP